MRDHEDGAGVVGGVHSNLILDRPNTIQFF